MRNIIKDTTDWLSIGKSLPTSKEELIKELELVKSLIDEEIDEMIQAVKDDNRSEQLNGFVDAQWCLNNAYYLLQITEDEYEIEADAVNKSNNTKFCRSYNEALITQDLYLTGKHPNKLGVEIETFIKETNNEEFPYVVVNSKNKLLKNFLFKDSDEFK
jgi:hypothetical protein